MIIIFASSGGEEKIKINDGRQCRLSDSSTWTPLLLASLDLAVDGEEEEDSIVPIVGCDANGIVSKQVLAQTAVHKLPSRVSNNSDCQKTL